MNRNGMMKLAALAMMGYASVANAAGFFLIEQSVSSMGNAYAGAAAVAEDATTLWFNPAGMMRLCGTQVAAGGHIVLPSSRFKNHGSLYKPVGFPTTPGNEIYGGNGKNGGEPALVGNFYATRRINDCWAVGLGVTSPFGLVTDWGTSWKGRYHAIRSAVLTININPSVAYKINNCWSVGAGFNAMYLHAKLTSAVDFGYLTQNPAFFQELDGYARVKGNSWGYGWNVGVLWEPECGLRVGASYRSQVHHGIKGREKFSNVPQLGSLPVVFQDTGARADVMLPAIAALSAYYDLNPCWAVLADVSWFQWSTVQRLRFRFNNEFQPDSITTLKWKNSFRYSFGATYRPTCDWQLKAGFAYDRTPIRNEELITPRIPDSNRYWITVGAHYDWNACLGFDVGYAHIFADSTFINKSGFEYEEDVLRGGLRGTFNSYTDIFSGQIVYKF